MGGALVALTLVLSGCAAASSPRPTATGTDAPGFDLATREIVRPDGPPGGTLRVLVPRDCDLRSPVAVVDAACANLLRATTRQLTAMASLPGRFGSVAVPDLATSNGEVGDDGLTWFFELRDGPRWSDGAPMKTGEVAEGVRRLASLAPESGIVDVRTQGTRIEIRLRSARPDLPTWLALPLAAPMRAGADSGPFTVARADPLVLVRNPEWDAATDEVRTPLVDRIEVFTIRPGTAALGAVLEGVADISLVPTVVRDEAEALLADPERAANTDVPGTGAVVHLAVPGHPGTVWESADCRRALFSAVDRTAVVEALGGSAAARTATTMSAPTIASYEPSYEPFPIGADAQGDQDSARALLADCGSSPTLRLSYEQSSSAVADAVRTSLAQVGVQVSARERAPGSASSNGAQIDAFLVVSSPVLPGVRGYWAPLVTSGSPANLGAVALPSVDALLAAEQLGSPDPDAQAEIGRLIDRLVLDTARYIPLAFLRTVSYRPPIVSDIATSGGYANGYDIVNLGIRGLTDDQDAGAAGASVSSR